MGLNALWVSNEVEVITGGRSTMPWEAVDLTIRQDDVRPGDLFFASPEDNLHHVFELGASAAVVSHGMSVPADIADQYPLLQVSCVYEALRALARAARFRTHSVVIAVQGFEQRRAFSRALGAVADYYEGGRHLSSSMAAMPEICDFSIFSLSPALQPDIVVIDKPAALRACGLFENMPTNGVVLMNMDAPGALDVLAQAKAAGLNNILHYSEQDKNAEICVMDRLLASNGMQATCRILGREVTINAPTQNNPDMPMKAQSLNMLMAAMAVVKLSDMRLRECAQVMARAYMASSDMSHPDHRAEHMKSISLLGVGDMGGAFVQEALFRVKNMIDTGVGRRTVVLEQGAPHAQAQDFTLPSRLGGQDVVCATKKISVFKNARNAVEGLIKGVKLQHIVPEVLTPGDYVVFKSSPDASSTVFSEALRAEG